MKPTLKRITTLLLAIAGLATLTGSTRRDPARRVRSRHHRLDEHFQSFAPFTEAAYFLSMVMKRE